jgi:hypothetical protein
MDTATNDIYGDEPPLQSGQIRLLTISPKKNGEDDNAQVRCKLKTVFLTDLPLKGYTALSYTWGHDKDRLDILVNKKTFKATRNLKEALQHFRSTLNPIPILWVDAICINQSHDPEKGEQVQLMQSIFSGAKETLVWLGPEANESRKAITLINDLSQVYHKSCPAGDDHTSPETADKTQWGSLKSPEREDKLEALNYLLARDYWYRVWVVQEIALSKTLTLFCGSHQFSWESLLFTAYLLNLHVETRGIYSMSCTKDALGGVLPGIQRILSIQSVRYDFQPQPQEELEKKPPKDSLLCLLLNHRFTEATEKKDKYIALAGIAKIDHAGDNLYARKLGAVYELACKSLAEEQRHRPLDFLDCVGVEAGLKVPRDPPVASWVPDWRITHGLPSPLLYWQFATKTHSELVFINAPGDARPFDKDKDKDKPRPAPAFSFLEKGLLWAKGRKIDTLGRVQESKPLNKNTHPQDQDQDQNTRPEYPNGDSPTDVLWRTLLQDRTPADGLEAPDYWGDILYNYLLHPPLSSNPSSLQQWWTQSKHFKLCGSTLEEVALSAERERKSGQKPLEADEASELAHIKTSFTIALGYRKLAATEKGYMCLVPQYARAGDVVVILVDCCAPVVLRQRENEETGYEFIGTCYVHGIMDGKAMVGLKPEQRIGDEFHIR